MRGLGFDRSLYDEFRGSLATVGQAVPPIGVRYAFVEQPWRVDARSIPETPPKSPLLDAGSPSSPSGTALGLSRILGPIWAMNVTLPHEYQILAEGAARKDLGQGLAGNPQDATEQSIADSARTALTQHYNAYYRNITPMDLFDRSGHDAYVRSVMAWAEAKIMTHRQTAADGGISAADPTGKPDDGAPTIREGYAFVTRTQEERDLVTSMIAQGKSQIEIQTELDNLRARRGALLGRNVSIVAQAEEPSTSDIAIARGLIPDLTALPAHAPWTPAVIDNSNPRLRARLSEAGLDDLTGWEGKAKTLRAAGLNEDMITKLKEAAILAGQPAIDAPRILTAPNGQQITLPSIASMPATDAQEWYQRHAHQVPDLIDRTASLEDQARQGFELRNAFRNAARSAVANRNIVSRALTNDPDKTWEAVVDKYKKEVFERYPGQIHSNQELMDKVYQEIINATTRTRYDLPGYIPPKYD